MQTIKEKKLLVKFAKSMGQPIDPALVEEVERYEALQETIKESVRTMAKEVFDLPVRVAVVETVTDPIVEPEPIVEVVEDSEVVEESRTEQTEAPNLIDRAAKAIKPVVAEADSYQQPSVPAPQDIKAIKDKLKFLEQWMSKISLAGPGGGEVNLRWLDDVDRSTIQDGYFLKYNDTKKKFEFVEVKAETALQDTGEPMGHLNRLESTISFDVSSRTFSISPVSAYFTIYTKGTKRLINNTRSVTIPNTTGLYYIYFDSAGVLQYRTSFFDWPNDCMTAYVYWNADTGAAPFVADERHGVVLDWQTHEYLHRTRGAAFANGFSASNYVIGGDGNSNTHIQLDIANGTFFDEDLQVDIVHNNTPTANSWEQDLQGPALIPIMYHSGNAWVLASATNFPVKQGNVRAQYNSLAGNIWSTTDIQNNKFGVTFVVATNNINQPVIGILGQNSYDTINLAREVDYNDLNLTGFPVVELRPLYRLIYDAKDNYTNTPKASLQEIKDLRKDLAVQVV